MLFYKAWLGSRVRFVAGIFAAFAVCFVYIRLHPILIPGWIMAMGQPKEPKPWWLSLGIHEYGFYLWHFLFENKLQQVIVLFAILFGLGGLSRERATGSALFSLGLPVSRRRWLLTRAAIALLEEELLCLCAAIAIVIASVSIHEPVPFRVIALHCMLLGIGAAPFTGLGLLVSMIFRGQQLAQLSVVLLLLIPYLVLQEFARGPHPRWQDLLNISSVLAGPWNLTWTSLPWFGVFLVLLMTAVLLWLGRLHGEQIDY